MFTHMVRLRRARAHWWLAVLIALVLPHVPWAEITPVASAEAVDVGYRDLSYPSGVGANSEVTAEKPESKLWWNDGSWWASMWSTSGNAYHIHKLDWSTQTWSDTGVQLDDRKDSKADVLWDGTKLYVVSHLWAGDGQTASAGDRGELFRYSYSGGVYSLDTGFPVEVNDAESEALVIAKDSVGTLWVTYVADEKVMVNHSIGGDDTNWGTPYMLPSNGASNVDSDDLSSIVAYNGRIGVMWSSQSSSERMYFAVHTDGDGDDAADWKIVDAYSPSGDDHINLKSLQSDAAGNIFAVIKTAKSAALIVLLVCKGDCTVLSNWSARTVYTGGSGSPTRPMMLIDTSNRELYVFTRIKYDGSKAGIYYKKTSIDNIQFEPDEFGTIFIKSSTETGVNDPTSTKQNVNSSTGLVVLASDSGERYYLHNCLALTGDDGACASQTLLPTVQFSSATYTADEGAGTATIQATLSAAAASAVSVDYATNDGTAFAGSDYTSASGTLTFAPGETSKSFTVPINDDLMDEDDESVSLALSNPSGATVGTPGSAILTITDNDDPPTVQFSALSYNVTENGGQATIEATLSAASGHAVSVDYATSDGTATAGSDYTAASGTLSFASGQTSQTFTVPILEDVFDEPDETIALTLSNPVNATLGTPANATLTIQDNDVTPTVQFNSTGYSANEGVGTAFVTATLSTTTIQTVTVAYATSDDTATAGSDYTTTSGTLTFAPGETSQTFSVPILDDALTENAEALTLALSNPTNALLGDPATASLAIEDNDDAPTAQFSAIAYHVDEDAGTATLDVTLSHAASQTVTVGYATSNGTANAGSDYISASGTLTFAPGETTQSITVPILDDTLDEGDETLSLTLHSPNHATLGTPASATLTLIDDDAPVTVQFSQGAYTETEQSSTALITVSLNHKSNALIMVDYATSDGTANAGSDYATAAGTLTFAPGTIHQTISVPILDDNVDESDETVELTLLNPSNAALGAPSSATLTIEDDDAAPTVSFDSATYNIQESGGQATVTVLLNAPSAFTITVKYSSSDGTATSDSDYVATSGTLTFAPGETSKSFTVPIMTDTLDEPEETIMLTLHGITNAVSGESNNAVLVIMNDTVEITHGLYLPLIQRTN